MVVPVVIFDAGMLTGGPTVPGVVSRAAPVAETARVIRAELRLPVSVEAIGGLEAGMLPGEPPPELVGLSDLFRTIPVEPLDS